MKLHNYRMFEKMEISFDPQYSIITGLNNSGKTTVLEAATISLGTIFTRLSGVYKYQFKLTDAHKESYLMDSTISTRLQFPVENSAEGVVNGKQVKWTRSMRSENGITTVGNAKEVLDISYELQKRLQGGDKSLILPVLAYYGANRLSCNNKENKIRYNTRVNGYIDCMIGTVNMKLMMNWFEKMTVQEYQRKEIGLPESPELHTVYRVIEECLSALTGYKDINIKYNLTTHDFDIEYIEGCRRIITKLSMLSIILQNIISIVTDISYRMATLNPQLFNKIITDTNGVVLIDDVELHMPKSWQQKIIVVLTKAFPKVQFIVTTNSSDVTSSVGDSHIMRLDNY